MNSRHREKAKESDIELPMLTSFPIDSISISFYLSFHLPFSSPSVSLSPACRVSAQVLARLDLLRCWFATVTEKLGHLAGPGTLLLSFPSLFLYAYTLHIYSTFLYTQFLNICRPLLSLQRRKLVASISRYRFLDLELFPRPASPIKKIESSCSTIILLAMSTNDSSNRCYKLSQPS